MTVIDERHIELVPLDLDTVTVAMMRSMNFPQEIINDEAARLGASLSAQKLFQHLPPLYLVRVK
jgi:hypothetical protein